MRHYADMHSSINHPLRARFVFFASLYCASMYLPYPIITQSEWSKFYATGSEIQANAERIVDKYKLRQYIHLLHELSYAKWDQETGKWTIRVRRLSVDGQEEEEIEETCDILLLCVGSLHRWHWPDIAGLKDFDGTLAHSADCDVNEKSVEGKRVGVVGNVRIIILLYVLNVLKSAFFKGSSGIQVVSAVHPKVKTLVNYARQKTWIVPIIGAQQAMSKLGRNPGDANSMLFHPPSDEPFHSMPTHSETHRGGTSEAPGPTVREGVQARSRSRLECKCFFLFSAFTPCSNAVIRLCTISLYASRKCRSN